MREAVASARSRGRRARAARRRCLRRSAALGEAVQAHRVANDLTDPAPRVERGVGVLEDHLHLAAKGAHLPGGQPGDLPALEPDRPRRRLQQAHDRPAERRLATSGLADEAEGLARLDGEADVVDGPHPGNLTVEEDARLDREVLDDVADLEQRAHLSCPPVSVTAGAGSEPTWSRSAMRPSIIRISRLRSPSSQQRSRWPAHAGPLVERGHLRALLEGVGAAGTEVAPLRGLEQRRRNPGDLRQPLGPWAVEPGEGAEQAPRVGVLGVVEDVVERALLDDPARIHHADAVGDLGDDAEVVGDDDHRHPELSLQLLEQTEDLRLGGDVESGGRLVGDQQLRLVCQRHRDHRPLPHPAGELVRVVVAHGAAGSGTPDHRQQLDRPAPAPRAKGRLRAPGSPRRSGPRSGGRDGATRAGPGRSSRCRRRAPAASPRR